MNSEIITVGSEILIGDIVDTNSSYLSKELNDLGISVLFHSTVGDNKNRLEETIKTALKRSDLIILTGGLGPTEDDVTKEVVAKAISKKLVESEEVKLNIIKKLEEKHQKLTKNNLKQCLIFENSKVFENDNGTAPGLAVKFENRTIIILPGPPKELSIMFEKSVKSYIKSIASSSSIKSRNIYLFGIPEAEVDEAIGDLLNQKNPSVGIYASPLEVRLRVTCSCENSQNCIGKIDSVTKEIEKRLGRYIYGIDSKNMQTALVKILEKTNQKIAIAESCTGGLIASKIVSVAGASKVFSCGIVCYSNEIKKNILNVEESTLNEFGAVSKQVAEQMAQNILKISKADIAISTTGNAGPIAESAKKPIGLVYIGIATKQKTEVKKLQIPSFGSNPREKIINLAALHAMNEARIKVSSNLRNQST